MFPILVYVGVEITAHSFKAVPQRHHAALALAILPALAALVIVPVNSFMGGNEPSGVQAQTLMMTLRCLANGFIVTSLLWAAALAAMIDGRLRIASIYLLVAAIAALFGIIHSPHADAPIALPGTSYAMVARTYGDDARFLAQSPYHWATAYGLSALVLVVLSFFPTQKAEE
jgi:AGZA family xanthine/uracil permease-like MFS transporter